MLLLPAACNAACMWSSSDRCWHCYLSKQCSPLIFDSVAWRQAVFLLSCTLSCRSLCPLQAFQSLPAVATMVAAPDLRALLNGCHPHAYSLVSTLKQCEDDSAALPWYAGL